MAFPLEMSRLQVISTSPVYLTGFMMGVQERKSLAQEYDLLENEPNLRVSSSLIVNLMQLQNEH